ncbi:hypothetical protein EF384_05460 [Aerococcus agrisoli]|uniref:Uncharacterized protein n=1 Tax=Aerococcus agrisoli TaxID=2487350 RepID=A0A3N4GGJ5_9LACT|nr:hypothetical protein EF384_05460 [Aerococcus agrisoli]
MARHSIQKAGNCIEWKLIRYKIGNSYGIDSGSIKVRKSVWNGSSFHTKSSKSYGMETHSIQKHEILLNGHPFNNYIIVIR